MSENKLLKIQRRFGFATIFFIIVSFVLTCYKSDLIYTEIPILLHLFYNQFNYLEKIAKKKVDWNFLKKDIKKFFGLFFIGIFLAAFPLILYFFKLIADPGDFFRIGTEFNIQNIAVSVYMFITVYIIRYCLVQIVVVTLNGVLVLGKE